MEKKKKFYAVARGRNAGIFSSWFGPAGAEAQVKDFPGARFKGFPSIEEARQWLAGGAAAASSQKPVRKNSERQSAEIPAPAAGQTVIFTDGGCSCNPGPGGYGAVIIEAGKRRELSGGYRLTTNNRMELMACIQALRALAAPAEVALYSDSKYVVDAVTKGWAQKWRRNGWRRTPTEMAENNDLWEELLALCEKHRVSFIWVRGHAGTVENERCDRLAVGAAAGAGLPPDAWYEARLKNSGK